jgi:uncharacterized damage-inducible protein DinB
MNLLEHFQMLARYNRIANERLYEKCAQLDTEEYRKKRQGSFGSIHALLNHILLGDRIWMSRFQGGGATTPVLSTVLFENFSELHAARKDFDIQIEAFIASATPELLNRSITYTNSKGQEYRDEVAVALSHMFNHQTHHRGQVHVMLSQTAIPPPSLDMHRVINP